MPFVYTPYVLPLVLAVLLTAVVASYIWPRRHAQGGRPLLFITLAITIWLVSYILELLSVSLTNKIWWTTVQYVGIALMPYFWLWFALAYTKQIQTRPWLPTLLYTLAILPLTTILLAFTNEWHNLLWVDINLTNIGDLLQLQINYGAWFWVHFVVSYLSLLAGTIVLLRSLWVKQELYRAQVVALMVAILAPWVSNILFFINLSPIPKLDLTPFAFTITIIALAWGLFRHQLINIAPIARDLIVEGMREGVLVINQQGRIVDINPAAAHLIGLPGEQAMGQEATEVLAPWPNLLAQLDTEQEVQGEILAGQVLYRFQIAPLSNANKQFLGQIITTQVRTTAVSNALIPPTAVSVGVPTSTTPASRPISRRQRLLRFFIPPPLADTTPLKGENIILSRLLEQAFTAMLRFALALATLALVAINPIFSEKNWFSSLSFLLPFIVGTALFGILGFARQIKFSHRANIFLIVLFFIALTELLNFGYSIEAFIFLFTLTIFSFILRGVRDGFFVALLSLIILLFMSWQITQRDFVPLALEQIDFPNTLQYGLATVLVWVASVTTIAIIITILLQSVNKAWWQETQAKNLLQQERDLLDQRVMERTAELRDREAVLEAVAFSTTNLLQRHDWRDSLQIILSKLGETIKVSRSYLFVKHISPQTQAVLVSIRYEWVAPGITPEINNPDLQNLPITRYSLRWLEAFEQGEAITGQVATLPKQERALLESQDILSIAVMPIMVGDDWWGFVGFDDCVTERVWKNSELEALLVVTNNLGAAIARQQQEEKLVHTAVNLAKAQAIGHMGNWEWNIQTQEITWSDEHYQLFGLSPQSITPTRDLFRAAIHPEDKVVAEKAIRQALEGIPYNMEYRIFLPDGRIRHMHSWAELIHNENGQPIRLSGVIQDITTRKEAEASLEAYAEQLALARDQALEASQYKSLLLSKVSHELRTPLGGILGYAELLHDDLYENIAEEQLAFIKRIIQNGQHLDGLIDDLLDQAQIEQGTIKLESFPTSIPQLCHFLQDLLAPLATQKGLTLSITASPALPEYATVDEKRLRQIVINLVNNAIKFTETGGVTVYFSPLENEHWQIKVSDTGLGIAPEAQQKIFDSFWQANRMAKGYGLGLSIVYQLVKLMHGRVWVESEIGQGSTFNVLLPLVEPVPWARKQSSIRSD